MKPALEPFAAFESEVLVLDRDHIDTDQIIPARFLKTTSREGLGAHCFADWRADAEFPLNRWKGEALLVAGDNFGCGSSREHAPWALLDAGFRAVAATSFGDIFRQNALKNGLLPIQVDAAAHAELLQGGRVRVELGALVLPSGRRADYPLDPFRRACLERGVDEIGYVLDQADAISAYEAGELQPLDTRG